VAGRGKDALRVIAECGVFADGHKKRQRIRTEDWVLRTE
jgi:hypothetical protein